MFHGDEVVVLLAEIVKVRTWWVFQASVVFFMLAEVAVWVWRRLIGG